MGVVVKVPVSVGLSGTYQRLHNGMIGGIHVGVEREGAFPLTVECCVALWCYDPVLLTSKPPAKSHLNVTLGREVK